MPQVRDTAIAVAAAVSGEAQRAAEVCERSIAAIESSDAKIGAFLEITAAHARSRAGEVDSRKPADRSGYRLCGVPIAVKDNIATRFGHTTCGSKLLSQYRSPFDATVIRRIEAAGGVIVGKTNCDEFAMGSSTENSGFRATCNPHDPLRVAGGSSGGSAAAVAAGMVPLALGSDTGGSVRQPAAFCGVVGLKPTYGRVSRYGLVAYGSSLDQIGPIAGNVTDAALLLSVIAGHDPLDSTSASDPSADYVAEVADAKVADRSKSLRIGVPREYFGAGLDPEVRAAVEGAVDVFRRAGASIVDVSLPHTQFAIAAYYLIATAECSSNLARFDGVHFGQRSDARGDISALYSASRAMGFGAEVKRRIMLGTFALAAGYYEAYYEKALRARRLIHQDFQRVFQSVDVLVSPTTPTPAFRLGEKTGNPLTMYLADIYTISANLAGVPAISVPCGATTSGLPIGLQLMGRHFDEVTLLQAARLHETWASR